MYIVLFRYTRAERDLKAARPYGEGAVQFYERAEVSVKRTVRAVRTMSDPNLIQTRSREVVELSLGLIMHLYFDSVFGE